jgi:hypothetical protein
MALSNRLFFLFEKGFPLPFSGWRSLFETSCAHWRVHFPYGETYCFGADSIGIATFHIPEMRWGWGVLCTPGFWCLSSTFVHCDCLSSGRDAPDLLNPLTVCCSHHPAINHHEASSRIHWCSPVPSFPGLTRIDDFSGSWPFLRASHLMVTLHACRKWEQG